MTSSSPPGRSARGKLAQGGRVVVEVLQHLGADGRVEGGVGQVERLEVAAR